MMNIMNTSDANNNMLSNTLREMLTWIKITSYPVAREIMSKEFNNPNDNQETRELKRKVYALTDGEKSSREIEVILKGKIRFATIATYQRKWRKQGLAVSIDPENQQSKTKKVFDLEDFELE